MNITPLAIEHHVGISWRGHIAASYDTLVRHLGAPGKPFDPGKSHGEWLLSTPLGPVNVYDYGDVHTCRPARARCRRNPATDANRDRLTLWSVQAEDDDVLGWLVSLDGVTRR